MRTTLNMVRNQIHIKGNSDLENWTNELLENRLTLFSAPLPDLTQRFHLAYSSELWVSSITDNTKKKTFFKQSSFTFRLQPPQKKKKNHKSNIYRAL